MSVWVVAATLGGLAVAIGYAVARAARSPLRPLYIPLTAWRLALGAWRTNRRVLLGITLVVLSGAALQAFFVNAPHQNAQVLQLASIFWQALVACLTAMLAVPLHLFVIHVYWRTRGVAERPESGWKLAPRAAAYGLAIWGFDYGIGVATKVLIPSTEPQLRELEYFGLLFISFLLTSLLALVRPSLSLGLAHPLRTGLKVAAKNALALYVVLAAIAIPANLLAPEATYVPSLIIHSTLWAHLISIGLISALNIFQYLTVEISTVLFAVGALLRDRDETVDAAESAEAQTPLARTS